MSYRVRVHISGPSTEIFSPFWTTRYGAVGVGVGDPSYCGLTLPPSVIGHMDSTVVFSIPTRFFFDFISGSECQISGLQFHYRRLLVYSNAGTDGFSALLVSSGKTAVSTAPNWLNTFNYVYIPPTPPATQGFYRFTRKLGPDEAPSPSGPYYLRVNDADAAGHFGMYFVPTNTPDEHNNFYFHVDTQTGATTVPGVIGPVRYDYPQNLRSHGGTYGFMQIDSSPFSLLAGEEIPLAKRDVTKFYFEQGDNPGCYFIVTDIVDALGVPFVLKMNEAGSTYTLQLEEYDYRWTWEEWRLVPASRLGRFHIVSNAFPNRYIRKNNTTGKFFAGGPSDSRLDEVAEFTVAEVRPGEEDEEVAARSAMVVEEADYAEKAATRQARPRLRRPTEEAVREGKRARSEEDTKEEEEEDAVESKGARTEE